MGRQSPDRLSCGRPRPHSFRRNSEIIKSMYHVLRQKHWGEAVSNAPFFMRPTWNGVKICRVNHVVKTSEDYFLKGIICLELSKRFTDRNLHSLLDGEPIDPQLIAGKARLRIRVLWPTGSIFDSNWQQLGLVCGCRRSTPVHGVGLRNARAAGNPWSAWHRLFRSRPEAGTRARVPAGSPVNRTIHAAAAGRELLAALTMASTASVVMSVFTISIRFISPQSRNTCKLIL